jgi:hypothetical protein
MVSMFVGEPNHAALPSHFHPDADLSREQWKDILPSFDRYPAIFRTTALHFLLAVLVYHLDRGDVERLFPIDHPYRRSGFYQRRPHFTKLKVGYQYQAEFDAVKDQILGLQNSIRTELPGEISAVLNDSLRRNFDFGMASINRDDVVGMLGSME